jgi:nicotinate-nucleotide pyrophosphorylase (carboxylating)
MNLCIDEQVAWSLQEDIGDGDITSLLIDPAAWVTAQIKTREPAIICGIPWVNSVYQQLDAAVELKWQVEEGQAVVADQILVTLSGAARSLLTGERCALNWLQTLSGTATRVRQFLTALQGTATQLLDTRKTIPGLRAAQKYAVRCGGGCNHRLGLFDAYLIKENHIAGCGSITAAVEQARRLNPGKRIEVEVENQVQLEEALTLQVEMILLDNFTVPQIERAVARNGGQAKLEVSGNVTLDNIRAVAATGIDYISVGALTKHLRAIDLSMRVLRQKSVGLHVPETGEMAVLAE